MLLNSQYFSNFISPIYSPVTSPFSIMWSCVLLNNQLYYIPMIFPLCSHVCLYMFMYTCIYYGYVYISHGQIPRFFPWLFHPPFPPRHAAPCRASRVAASLGRQACEGSVRVVHLAHLADAQQVFSAGQLCAGGEGGHLHLISWISPRFLNKTCGFGMEDRGLTCFNMV